MTLGLHKRRKKTVGREKSEGNKVAVINKKRGENQTTEGIQKKREYKKGGSNKKKWG